MGQPSQRQPSPRQPSPRPFTQLGRRALFAIGFAALVLGLAFGGPATVTSQRRPQRAPIPDDAPPRPENNTTCNYQEPIDYLVRENFLPRWTQPPEEQRRREALQAQAVQFRTEQYGYFEGFGRSSWNEHPPMHYAERTRFMDLNVRLNAKIIPALACVEEQIRAECADEAYTPVRLSGIRDRNTYHNGQVSNHVYGIAIDVDPQLNTCCMCVAQWGDHPLCQREVESIYERMSMPSCWVHVFERFGFYWLGRDRLQDTMHFEFLGDPDHVLKTQGAAPHMAGAEVPAEPAAAPEGASENAEQEVGGSGEAETPPAEELTMSEAPAPTMASAPVSEAEEAPAEAASAGCSVSAPGR